jgi:hypothetical protein
MKGGFKFEVQYSFYAASKKQQNSMRKFDLCTDRKLRAVFSAVFPNFLVIFFKLFYILIRVTRISSL